MREDIALGSGQEGCGSVCIDFRCEASCGARAVLEGREDLCFATLSMGNEPCEALRGVCDWGAMACMKHPPAVCGEAGTAGHEVAQVAVGWANEGAGPAHNQIAAKECVAPSEGKVIAKVAWGVVGGKRPALA